MHRYVKCLVAAMLFFVSVFPFAHAQVLTDRNMLMPELSGNWKTLETVHFRIHHEDKYKAYAQQVATIAERVHARLSPWLGWQPQDATEIVLLDTVDLSNGYASPLPYNHISIYMLPPVDGELMDQTPWLEMVITHEYVHILHLDMASGSPQAMRNIFGRSTDLFTLFDFPQLFAPSWVTEGLAVYGESGYAGEDGNAAKYGRLNSAFFDAMMRMEVQRGLRSLTEVTYNAGYRWPYGQMYLYGAYFFKFVEEKYGREAVVNYIKVYGDNLIPFRMETRSLKIFNKYAYEVWVEYQDYLTRRFSPQLDAIRHQNRFATHTVYDAPYSNSALTAASNGDLYFLHDDASSSPQIRRLHADGSNEAVLEGRGVQDMDWHDESGLLISKFAVCNNTNVYSDLYQWQPGLKAAKRLTHCGRYVFAVWRPDGKAIAAIQFEAGLSRLVLLDSEGKFISLLADMPMGDVLGHIDWSPDGASVVASIQRKKSGWNLELLDVHSQQWQALTYGNDLVQKPRFAADGTGIYFLSDHDRVWNLRRLALGSKKIDTISNTTSAILEAVQMPDQSYRMVEYTPDGKAIVAVQPQSETDVNSYNAHSSNLQSVVAISNDADYQPYPYTAVKDYTPWNTLRPHSWFPLLGISADRTSTAGFLMSGSDALSFHTWQAAPLYYYDLKQLGGLANYSFYNTLTLSVQRQFLLQGNKDAAVRYLDDEQHYQALLHHLFNTYDSSTYVAGGVARELIDAQVFQGAGVAQKFQNTIAGVIAQYDNSRFYKLSVAPVDGRRLQLLEEGYVADSDYSGKTLRLDWNEYIALRGNNALHVRLLRAEGDTGIRAYRLGGVNETLSTIGGVTGLGRRSFPLRGYPAGLAELAGSNMGLFTAEWAIPLGYHYDGLIMPPVGIGRESLTLFVDSADAWNQGEAVELRTGLGIEWNIETLLGYDLLHLATTLGYAKGVDQGGESQLYLKVVLPFL